MFGSTFCFGISVILTGLSSLTMSALQPNRSDSLQGLTLGSKHTYSRNELLSYRPPRKLSRTLPDSVVSHIKSLGLKHVIKRGCRGGRSQLRKQSTKEPATLNFALLNARSVRNKTVEITEYIDAHKLDILCITETWLGLNDQIACGEITPEGYRLEHKPRTSRRGGGVGVIFRQSLKYKRQDADVPSYTSFEHMMALITSRSKTIRLVIVYRPPGQSILTFIDEFAAFLDRLTILPFPLVITGDFNVHIDKPSECNVNKILALLDANDLQQFVCSPTHTSGHILDLLIARNSETLLMNVSIFPGVSDHLGVHCTLTLPAPEYQSTEITFRKYKNIDKAAFQSDILQAFALLKPNCDLDYLVGEYNSVLQCTLNKHAPMKTIRITPRPDKPWFNQEIAEAKRLRRRRERKWRLSKLTVDLELYKMQCSVVTELINSAKRDYFSTKISVCSNDSKSLFSIVEKLLHTKTEPVLPEHISLQELADRFSKYFISKIEDIRSQILASTDKSLPTNTVTKVGDNVPSFASFQPLSDSEMRKLITSSPSKSCSLDPIPTWLLKECLDGILPFLSSIVNKSMTLGYFPRECKTAIVRPLIKKPKLDPDTLKNYRPISNLSFVSKLIERAVNNQTSAHLTSGGLYEPMQSAYRAGYSVETCLLKVQNDLLCALDHKQCVYLTLLDLSAAFDTVDHRMLLTLLQTRFGFTDLALQWMHSYLTERTQSVYINGITSAVQHLTCGVPQGSVLGPVLFTLYTTPLGQLIRSHSIEYCLYADDTQIYLPFDETNKSARLLQLETCIGEIRNWMKANMLKLNEEKTEFLVIRPPRQDFEPVTLKVGDAIVPSSKSARNLGVIFNEDLNMESQVRAICRSAKFHLRNISKIRPFLDNSVTERVIHSLITCRLDTANSLLIGTPKYVIDMMQGVQNCAVRLLFCQPKYTSVSHLIRKAHWLPVHLRILYKVLLLTYNAMNSIGPSYISRLLPMYQPPRVLRSQNKKMIDRRSTQFNYATLGGRAFHSRARSAWNDLPLELKNSPNTNTFKKRLKTHLFSKL